MRLLREFLIGLSIHDGQHPERYFNLTDNRRREVTEVNLNVFPSSTVQIEAFVNETMGVESVVFDFGRGNEKVTVNEAPFTAFPEPIELPVDGEVQDLVVTLYKRDDGIRRIISRRLAVRFRAVREGPLLKLPEFLTDWIPIPDYPLDVGESQGGRMGNFLVNFGGFLPGFATGAVETFAMDLTNPVEWIQLADNPINFWTHAAFAIVDETKLYACGGYRGENPGPAMMDCYVFTFDDVNTTSWEEFPFLPTEIGAGGMVYVESMNSLFFSMGAIRPNPGSAYAEDQEVAWMISLDDIEAGWVPKTPSPYLANHVTAVTVDGSCDGVMGYFFLGGQEGGYESYGNVASMYEYFPTTDSWEKRADIPAIHAPKPGKGHTTPSTLPYGCGFIMVGGAANLDLSVNKKVPDILYYDVPTDTWSKIGEYPQDILTAVCAIWDDVLTCTSGYIVEGWSRTLSFPDQ